MEMTRHFYGGKSITDINRHKCEHANAYDSVLAIH